VFFLAVTFDAALHEQWPYVGLEKVIGSGFRGASRNAGRSKESCAKEDEGEAFHVAGLMRAVSGYLRFIGNRPD